MEKIKELEKICYYDLIKINSREYRPILRENLPMEKLKEECKKISRWVQREISFLRSCYRTPGRVKIIVRVGRQARTCCPASRHVVNIFIEKLVHRFINHPKSIR